jgi:diguanylate cyclase (GGDEF)-like protein
MTTDRETSFKYVNSIAAMLSSLRLKDVLDATVTQYAQLAQVNKVAVFLADNQGKFFRLMAAKGYSEFSLQQMKVVPFEAQGILSEVFNIRMPIIVKLKDQFDGFNRAIFDKEQSVNQIALPLNSTGLLIGAILIDSSTPLTLDKDIWQLITNLTASAIANAIIFGRSEYERERLSTLYKTLSAFQASALSLNQVLRQTADAALVLGNTPYCAILLTDQDSTDFKLSAFKGLDATSLSGFDLSVSNALATKILNSGKGFYLIEDLTETVGMPKAMGGTPFRSILALPLIYDEKKLGILEIFSTDEHAFQQEQIDLLEALASQVSNAIFLAQNHQSAIEQTVHDPHTGLLNRLYFKSAVKAEMERSNRHDHQFALWLIDIDYLSKINDRLGQVVGDEVISKVAKTIKETLREIDLVYRLGGEEFAVILPETSRETMPIVVARLREKIKNTLIPDVGTVTVSLGIGTYPDHSKDVDELINLAEEALFIAKYNGRDRALEAPIPSSGADTDAWVTLAKHAKQAVSTERQERAKSHLSSSADYANWLLRIRNGTSRKSVITKDQVPLP